MAPVYRLAEGTTSRFGSSQAGGVACYRWRLAGADGALTMRQPVKGSEQRWVVEREGRTRTRTDGVVMVMLGDADEEEESEAEQTGSKRGSTLSDGSTVPC